MAETDSGEPAIVPGDVDASTLIARITSDDEFERMPPEGDPVSPARLKSCKADGSARGPLGANIGHSSR